MAAETHDLDDIEGAIASEIAAEMTAANSEILLATEALVDAQRAAQAAQQRITDAVSKRRELTAGRMTALALRAAKARNLDMQNSTWVLNVDQKKLIKR